MYLPRDPADEANSTARSHGEKKSSLSVVAERDLEAGDLIIPLFCRRANSIVLEGEWHADHHTSIGVDIEWREPNISEHLEDKGIGTPPEHSIALWLIEEVGHLKTDDGHGGWSGQEDLHPFWVVKRQKEGKDINCKVC